MEEKKEEKADNESFSVKLKKYIKNLTDFSQYDKKTIFSIIVFVFLLVLSLGLLFYNYFIDTTFFYRIIITYFVNVVYGLGVLGYLLYLGVMMVQALIVPIPSEIILLTAGIIWPFWIACFLAIVGSMISAMLAYYVGKKGGRPFAEKMVGENALGIADKFIKKYDIWAIIIARFLPFVAFDPISYASGVVNMDAKKYALGTLIGVIPRAIFYVWLGSTLGINPKTKIESLPMKTINTQAAIFNNMLLLILGFLVVMFALYYISNLILTKKREKQTLKENKET